MLEHLGEPSYRALVDTLFEGLYLLDAGRTISYWNPAAQSITGYPAAEVLGRPCSDGILLHTDAAGRSLCGTELCPAAAALKQTATREQRFWLRHKEGHRVPISVRASALCDSTGGVVGSAQLFTPAGEELQERVRELERLAVTDELTGLGNRRFAEDNLRARLDELKRYGWPFGLLFVDVDGFKTINDSLGHRIGDRLLHVVARTLASNVRAHDLVCRWGGDEFVVVLTNVQDGRLRELAEKLCALVSRSSYSTDHGLASIAVSVGATIARQDDSLDSLMQRADELMYESKRAGGSCVTMTRRSAHRVLPQNS